MRTLKCLFILLTVLSFVVPGAAAAESVYKVGIIPYYHNESGCSFGDFTVYSGFDMPETVEISSATEAEATGLRPCPACATDFRPVFTGDFPEWKHETAPWDFGGPDTYLTQKVRAQWGDAANAIYEIAGEGPYPDDYAGIFVNASGGYTVMMVNPTPERIEKYRKTLKSEFWVMEASYNLNYLYEIQAALTDIMGFDGLNIHSLSAGVDCNCVIIGTNDTSPSAQSAIEAYLAMKGYDDPRAFILQYQEPAVVTEF